MLKACPCPALCDGIEFSGDKFCSTFEKGKAHATKVRLQVSGLNECMATIKASSI